MAGTASGSLTTERLGEPGGLAEGVEPLVAHLYGKTFADIATAGDDALEREPSPVDGLDVTDTTVPIGPDAAVASGSVPVRRYEPTAPSSALRPAVTWVHGGAWMFGDLDQPEADAVARRLAARLDAVVYSVDYRLAPAHTFPAALEDVVAAYLGTVADPAVDGDRVIIGGASAGGNIVAGAVQRLRDAGAPMPVGQFLVYPATDPRGGPYGGTRPDVVPEMLWFTQDATTFLFDVYTGGAADQRYATPAVESLHDLPPALVTTSTLDGLEDQALRYADLLAEAGTDVVVHRVDGVLHGYLSMCGIVDAADAALARHADVLAGWLAD